MTEPTTPDCGHAADPATGTTLCYPCTRALPPQPMTVYFLGDGDSPPSVQAAWDTDKIPYPGGYKRRVLFFPARDGSSLSASVLSLDGSVRYVHVCTDLFDVHRFAGPATPAT